MKRIKSSFAIILSLTLIFGLLPGISAKAANSFTDIEYKYQNMDTDEIIQSGKATLTLLNANYNSLNKDEYFIICNKTEKIDYLPFYDLFKDNIDPGYDVFFYDPRIGKVYADWDPESVKLSCSVTMPCPVGYDPSTAVLLYAVSSGSDEKIVAASSTKDTFTMNIPIGAGFWDTETPGYFVVEDHWLIEMHKHDPNTEWSHDEKTHWHTCKGNCGIKLDVGDHTFDAGVKANRKITYTCTVCGYQKVEDIKVAENEIIKDETSGAEYKVTSIKDGTATVEFEKSEQADAKKINVPDTITLPDGTVAKVTSIAPSAFSGNQSVTSITVGNNVETIGANAFSDCPKLKNLTIGKNVKSIGAKACKGSPKLNKVTIKSTKLKKIGKNAFKLKKGAVIKVPKKQKKAYEKLLKKSKLPAGVKVK